MVPFGFMDEKRDLYWRWRPIFHRTFSTAPEFTSATTITEAVHALASLIPKAAMAGAILSLCLVHLGLFGGLCSA